MEASKAWSFICTTCGTEYEMSPQPPKECKICCDERQYIGPKGQDWTILGELNKDHKNIIEKVGDNLYAIYTTPSFAIGQRAHLLKTPTGNILWDCIANLDASTIDIISHLGGIDVIAISHPHYYTTMADWSAAFNNAPVYIHGKDEEWISRKGFNLKLWTAATNEVLPGVTAVNCGGHFPGGSVLHYEDMLLVGDLIQVCPDLKTVSFMYSFPNYIPLPKKDILHIQASLQPYEFNAMYGSFGRYIKNNAKNAFQYSIDRYLKIFE